MEETIYCCPIHQDVRQSQRGMCYQCGMVLVQSVHLQEPRSLDYVCPEHPKVRRDHPGRCPSCGATFVHAA